MGAFFPYFRNHSAIDTLRQEPWAFGAETEEIIRKYIGLRYRWLPHIYNLFQEAAATGLPVIRPLVLEYPNDPNVTNLCDQFLLGDAVLIAAGLSPRYGSPRRLFAGRPMVRLLDGRKARRGRHILAACPLDTMPMYVKSGAIVPEGALAQHADDQTNGNLTFHIYGAEAQSGFQAEYSLYEDDGATYDYRDQTYSRLNVRLEGQEGGLKLSYAYAHRQYEANRSLLRFKLCRPEFAPSGVQGLDAITAEQLGEGAEGWHVDGEGSLIIQAADLPSGASWMITAAN